MSARRICSSSGSNGDDLGGFVAAALGTSARARRSRRRGTVSRERSSSRRRTSRSRRPIASSGSTSQTRRCSAKPGARATTSPASSRTTEWPSKTSSSWPPTRLQNARKELVSRARVTSMSSRSSALPTWNGEAERFTSSCAPASARSVAGGPGCHTSSQIVGPDVRVPEAEQHEVAALGEVAVLVEDAVVRAGTACGRRPGSRRPRTRRRRSRGRGRTRACRRARRGLRLRGRSPRARRARHARTQGGAAGPRADSR